MKSTKKVSSLVKTMMNYCNNWLKSKESQKNKSESLLNLIEKVRNNKAYLRLVILNLLAILNKKGFLSFNRDKKEVVYDE